MLNSFFKAVELAKNKNAVALLFVGVIVSYFRPQIKNAKKISYASTMEVYQS